MFTHGENRPPKRTRRTINSCLECRRRKVRCQPNGDESGDCLACITHGIQCEKSGEPSSDEPKGSPTSKLEARLVRVENLLEKMASRQGLEAEDCLATSCSNLALSENAVPVEAHGRPPLLSVFDNIVLRGQDTVEEPRAQAHSNVDQSSHGSAWTQYDKIQRALVATLPNQAEADIILTCTNAWGLQLGFHAVNNSLFQAGKDSPTLDMVSISRSSPLNIAHALLYLAICTQQLPHDFDESRLPSKLTIDEVLNKYLSQVTSLITSNDDLVCSLEGLRCLLLQSLFYINDGNLHRAWLVGRRAINFAQLIGLQKEFFHLPTGPLSEVAMERRIMWHKVVMVDRYTCVLLGLPCAVGHDCFGDSSLLVKDSIDSLGVFERRLCLIAGWVAERDQKEVAEYSKTLEIDDKMELLGREMSSELYIIPHLSPRERSNDAANKCTFILNQMWFFQLKKALHLPFMLRAFNDTRFEYSKTTCLEASRQLLHRYLILRGAQNTQLQTRVVDFGTLIAVVTLLLDQFHQTSEVPWHEIHRNRASEDKKLILNVVESMRAVAQGRREKMAQQAVQVMDTLLLAQREGSLSQGKVDLRLTIPFFGTITLSRGRLVSSKDTILSSAQQRLETGDTVAQVREAGDSGTFQSFGDLVLPDTSMGFEQMGNAGLNWFPPSSAWNFDDSSFMLFGEVGEQYKL